MKSQGHFSFTTRITVLLICLLVSSFVCGQNLIRDGSFEQLECPDNPINSVDETPTWYAINTDFYYISERCPFDQTASVAVNALNQPVTAFDGVGFASLEAGLSTNGYFISEGTAIEIERPMQAGRFYYFEMQTVHYPPIEGIDFPDSGCQPMPTRYMSVYTSADPIEIGPETIFTPDGPLTTGISSNAYLRLLDRAPDEPGFTNGDWNFFWDCFEGDGSEKHIAITGSIRKEEGPHDCILEDQPGRLYFGGHAIDDVKLFEIPLAIDSSFLICPGGIPIVLRDLVNAPYFDKAHYIWEDGSEETSRFIEQPGIYRIDMELPCTTVPITLDITEVDCLADIYVANAFTPNGDGINDLLIPGIDSPFELSHFRFSIYDRWGQLIYVSGSTIEGWDGRYNGRHLNAGIFAWIIEYEINDGSGTRRRLSGDVLVVR